MRCLCGNIMSTQEMCQKQENGEYETLCSACLSEVANIDEPEEREYKFKTLLVGCSLRLKMRVMTR
jgi:hypothetical protein